MNRHRTLQLDHTVAAASVVLSAFMGGLALDATFPLALAVAGPLRTSGASAGQNRPALEYSASWGIYGRSRDDNARPIRTLAGRAPAGAARRLRPRHRRRLDHRRRDGPEGAGPLDVERNWLGEIAIRQPRNAAARIELSRVIAVAGDVAGAPQMASDALTLAPDDRVPPNSWASVLGDSGEPRSISARTRSRSIPSRSRRATVSRGRVLQSSEVVDSRNIRCSNGGSCRYV